MKVVSTFFLIASTLGYGFASDLHVVEDFLTDCEIDQLLHVEIDTLYTETKSFGAGCISGSVVERLQLATGKECRSDDEDWEAGANIATSFINGTTNRHQDYYDPEIIGGEPVSDEVAFIFLNDNPDAEFVHGEIKVPVVAGSLVTFMGNVEHNTVVRSGSVRLAGPFQLSSLAFVGAACCESKKDCGEGDECDCDSASFCFSDDDRRRLVKRGLGRTLKSKKSGKCDGVCTEKAPKSSKKQKSSGGSS
jgi:hypothetical protein